ncbi:MAG: hypothetical protein IM624_11050 [Phenylobacterium sp.]|uniref:hypothetical protein n=1 Tax=Phenylobacterium sp. TaxID=1871053 RepID=UPI0025E7238A|nr:hypothetical protein [Phenylobacterium sp.]MCA6295862.1 hypothetical protein [Phenylobacterium sp.]MCA6299723.1 hypothetical protein [Phenylobacterium sp.]
MSDSARIHTPDVPLGRLIRMPGGKNAGQAVEDAEKGLESMQAESMRELNRVLKKAEDLYSRAEGKFSPLIVNAFYDLINGAIGLPTAGKDRAIDSMLVSLADLLDYYRTSGEWGDKSVQVHLSTFQLLLRTEGARDAEGTAAILSGLQKVSRKAARG